jgi:hypothetical protein
MSPKDVGVVSGEVNSRTVSPKSAASSVGHVTSVGIGTDSKQYITHGAQTKDSGKVPPDVTVSVGGHAFQPQRKGGREEFGVQTLTAGSVPSGGLNLEALLRSGVVDANKGSATATGNVHPFGGVKLGAGKGAMTSGLSATVNTVSSSSFVTLSKASSLSSASGTSQTVIEHKRHSPSPTSTHSHHHSIPIPSSHPQSHTHLHQPSPLARSPHHHTVPSSSGGTLTSTVNHVPTHFAQSGSARSTRVKQEVGVGKAEGEERTFSASYHPHPHLQKPGGAQPAQTITSERGDGGGGPVVKAFVPVIDAISPPVYQPQAPSQPPSSHINPFTFPTTGVKIHMAGGDGPSYSYTANRNKEIADTIGLLPDSTGLSHVGRKSVSDLTGLRPFKVRQICF